MSAPGARRPIVATIREDPELAREIERRAEAVDPAPSVTVSDLLGLRRAYWRRRAPATPIADGRRERMESGRAAHLRLAAALPDEGTYEVRVRRGGIGGRIDLLADVPVEVKTGVRVGPDRLLTARPDHVEQLAMYCALGRRPVGRIVTLDPGPAPSVEAVDVEVRDPAAVAEAMAARRRSLAVASAEERPTGLPACRWYGRGCEFQDAGVCDCDGGDPEPIDDIVRYVQRFVPRPEIEARWRAALAAAPLPVDDPGEPRLRELLYPRRSYFERMRPRASPPAPPPPAPADRKELYAWLVEAIESGPLGEVAGLPARTPGDDEEVAGFRGSPYLVKTSRAARRLRPEEIAGRFPQYVTELALRCAASGTRQGRIFLAFERAEREADRYEVLTVRFDPPSDPDAERQRRVEEFRSALAEERPATLPPCPPWMEERCPYRPECGCAADAAGRS